MILFTEDVQNDLDRHLPLLLMEGEGQSSGLLSKSQPFSLVESAVSLLMGRPMIAQDEKGQ